MNLQTRRAFIISFVYFTIIGLVCYLLFKKLIPMLMPFIAALTIAAVLDPAVSLVETRIGCKKEQAAVVVLLLFYGCILGIMALAGSRAISMIQEQGKKLPAFYSQVVEPGLSHFFVLLEHSFPRHSTHISTLGSSLEHAMENAASALSSSLIGWGASVIVGFPTLVVDLLVTVIASFFLTGSYHQVISFLLRQLSKDRRSLLIKAWVCTRDVTGRLVRAYVLLMSLTFAELYAGFWILGVPMAFTTACLITLVDILPLLGTGTILLPWALIAWVSGPKSLGIGLLCLYLLITVIRQSLEPKVIGQEMGLSPAAALLCIFAGGKLLGLPGIFLFPIAATVLVELNDAGVIHILK